MLRYVTQCILILSLCMCVSIIRANASTITALSCSYADVSTAYNASSSGDIIRVPGGSCSWVSYLKIAKPVNIIGAGINRTTITPSTSSPIFWVFHDNVHIRGFTFNCNKQSLSNGAILVGDTSINPTGIIRDFHIDNNRFIDCDCPAGGCTGYPSLRISGFTYGVIDSNTFDDCRSECILVCADGVAGLSRTMEYGQYENGTVYIEDNTWNYNKPGTAENALDGNSASRYVVRYNTFNFAKDSKINAIISTHETGATCSGSSTIVGDAGSVLTELYNNTVNINASMQTGGIFVDLRGGRSLIYNNRYPVYNDVDHPDIAKFHAFRSTNLPKPQATHPRGYSGWCHEMETGFTSEGRLYNKTTLNGDIDTIVCPTLAIVTDISTEGGSIIIGNEQIDYTGISGNTLTGCIRGANLTTASSHLSGANVDILVFGKCLEQINNTYVWGNTGAGGSDKNSVWVEGGYRSLPDHNDYVGYDIKSFNKRPYNWQYRNDGTQFSYTPYTYPHPLRKKPSVPTNLR